MTKLRVLTDYHHSDLFESLCLLFEDRFGFELYIPQGMEWFNSGIWGYPVESTAHQYLEHWAYESDEGDHWAWPDTHHPPRVVKRVTLEQARSQKWDMVLATFFHNQVGFNKLAKEWGVKFGLQIGNMPMADHFEMADFVLFSTAFGNPPTCPYVQYHQEFSLKDFRFEYPPSDNKLAATWVNLIGHSNFGDFDRFKTLANDVPELDWRCYGHDERAVNPYWRASLAPISAVAESMRSARVAIHFKGQGDGFGHVVHTIFACGKPVIATASVYRNMLAAPLFVDGVTSWDVQSHTRDENAQVVRRLASDDDFHRKMSEASAARFKEVVNFDADAQAVKTLLERVLP